MGSVPAPDHGIKGARGVIMRMHCAVGRTCSRLLGHENRSEEAGCLVVLTDDSPAAVECGQGTLGLDKLDKGDAGGVRVVAQ